MTTKVCSKCKVEKDVGEFMKNRSKKDGTSSACKACIRLVDVKWRTENPGKVKACKAKWYAENREKVKARRAKWYAENREKALQLSAKWYAANPEKVRARKTKECVDLHDAYVRLRLQSPNPPQELIELKRLQLQIHREIYKKEGAGL